MGNNEKKYEALLLKNQLCFPLYAVSNMIVRKYKPYLKKLDLTYTQYITMMLLWENTCLTMGELRQKLFLDSGTLSPVLQRLEEKGYIERVHLEEDERYVVAISTDKGDALRKKAINIPQEMAKQFNIEQEEAKELYRILYKILNQEERAKNNSKKGID